MTSSKVVENEKWSWPRNPIYYTTTSLSQNMEKGVTKQTIYVWLNFDNFQTILVKTLTTLATIL